MPASGNHSPSETTLEQKINVLDNLSGANFPNLLMSVKNVYNFDANPWPKNTILIAGDSMIQFVIFKPLSCFKETIKFDVKASFASRP